MKKSQDLEIIQQQNNEIEDIIKIVKSLEHSGFLLKEVSETVQNDVKEQKGGFLSMLLGTLCASLLGNLLKCQGKGRRINRAGEGILRACYEIIKQIFNATSSSNFEIQKY